MENKKARLIYGSTYLEGENSSLDLRWLVKMKLPDAHFFIEFGKTPNKRVLLANMLEFSRARKQARNCRVELLDKYEKNATKKDLGGVVQFLRSHGVLQIEIHPLTPAVIMEKLAKAGFKVSIGELPWYPGRLIRTAEELKQIIQVERQLESVFELVRMRLAKTVIKDGVIFETGNPLTSEIMRKFIEDELYKRGCASIDTIVSSGAQVAVPHDLGSGPLRARSPIVFDIYPYARDTGRFADMTRTLFKGIPDREIINMYETVRKGQELGIGMARSEVDGKEIHLAIEKFFRKNRYPTNSKKGEGFIHSTGHSLNLWLHEPPSISRFSQTLKTGMLLTIEPGLYYPRRKMGVRLEDMVVIEKNGCRNLTKLPKDIKWAVIP